MYSKDLEICAYLQQKSWLLLWSSPHQVLYIIQYCCLLVQPLQGQFTTPFYSRSFDPLPWLHIWCHYCLVQPPDPYRFSITALFLIPSITLSLKLGCSLWRSEWVRHHINKWSESIAYTYMLTCNKYDTFYSYLCSCKTLWIHSSTQVKCFFSVKTDTQHGHQFTVRHTFADSKNPHIKT